MRFITTLILLTLFSVAVSGQTNGSPAGTGIEILKGAQFFEEKMIEALRKGDLAALEKMLADEFIFIHSTGGIETRGQYLENLKATVSRNAESKNFETKWMVYSDTAIRYSRSTIRYPNTGAETRLRNIAVYVKTPGGWRWASGQSTKLPVHPAAAAVAPKIYDGYTGVYRIDADRVFIVTKENGALFGLVTGRNKAELIPASDENFVWFNENNDVGFVEVAFARGADGKAAEVLLRQNGMQMWRAKKEK